MYRFRKTNRLLEELEKQEIYFASIDELNDQLEGRMDLYWVGDKIIWENFLRHYLLSLNFTIQRYIVSKDVEYSILIYITEQKIEGSPNFDIFQIMKSKLFDNEIIQKIIHYFSHKKNPVYQNELELIMQIIHPIFLEIICDELNKNLKDDIANSYFKLNSFNTNFDFFIDFLYQTETANLSIDEEKLVFKSILENNIPPSLPFFDYPLQYLERIKEFIYPKWYVSCFTDSYDNKKMWDKYADNGVCLIYNDSHINFESFNEKMKFKKVSYHPICESVDFFCSMMELSGIDLFANWYTDKNGTKSICFSKVFTDIEKNRTKHWDKFDKIITTKTEDWKYENEYRIIIYDILKEFEEKNKRYITYCFDDLNGIIFWQISDYEKKKIIEIINLKCKEIGRKQFDFFQASYDSTKKIMVISKLK